MTENFVHNNWCTWYSGMGGFTPPKISSSHFLSCHAMGRSNVWQNKNGCTEDYLKCQWKIGQRSHFRTEEAKFIPNFYQVEDLGKKWVGRETTGFPLSNTAVTIAVYGHNFPRTCLLYFAFVIVVNCDSHKSTKRSNFSITPITYR